MSLADADSSSARPQQQADIRLVHGGAFGVGSDKHRAEEASVHRLTGVLTVDGNEIARKTIPHTIPILMTIDETFDIGSDTRTTVDDSYKLPFRFTGKIDKLTYKLGPTQMTGDEQRLMRHALERARD